MGRTTVNKWIRKAFVASFFLSFTAGWAAPPGLAGDWMTPHGSVVRVQRCGGAICLTLVKVASDVKVTTDKLNPDAALRTRPLCGLRIGDGFQPQGDSAASGGKLYDPQAGKTYSGKIAIDGETLRLRGYIGVSLFGRSEVWNRVPMVEACR